VERLENFELSRWIKEDLISLLDDYPTLFEMTENELHEIIKEKNFIVRQHPEKANIFGSEVIALQKYYDVKYGDDLN
jgi:hypothetical protein